MSRIVMPDLTPDTLDRLKSLAKLHGRSLEDEVKTILEGASTISTAEASEIAIQLQKQLNGGRYGDGADPTGDDFEQ